MPVGDVRLDRVLARHLGITAEEGAVILAALANVTAEQLKANSTLTIPQIGRLDVRVQDGPRGPETKIRFKPIPALIRAIT